MLFNTGVLNGHGLLRPTLNSLSIHMKNERKMEDDAVCGVIERTSHNYGNGSGDVCLLI